MFEPENIREWLGLNVVDQDGDKVGTLESYYFDTATEKPAFATVQMGLLGGKRLTFVPLEGVLTSPKYLKVAYGKKVIKDAPSIDTDGELEASKEPEIYQHYGLTYSAGTSGERRLGRR
ncbi:PRC-barrel domain-containing protein [Frondihabitans cladoniiphilus]|uniref:PRC-barrel domain-containing protein n=1 Tax=Frondihabitans cladoniiphilus TaxID=715785 RepID=A0ABP8VY07_9MICO